MAYRGRYASVHVPALGRAVKRGESVEIEDKALARALRRQGWREVKRKEGDSA